MADQRRLGPARACRVGIGVAFVVLGARLREWRTPIIVRVDEGQVVLDLRTIAPNEDREVLAALASLEG